MVAFLLLIDDYCLLLIVVLFFLVFSNVREEIFVAAGRRFSIWQAVLVWERTV